MTTLRTSPDVVEPEEVSPWLPAAPVELVPLPPPNPVLELLCFLRDHGWVKGSFHDHATGSFCLIGGARRVFHNRPQEREEVERLITNEIRYPIAKWNDSRIMFGQVERMLRKVALEWERHHWST